MLEVPIVVADANLPPAYSTIEVARADSEAGIYKSLTADVAAKASILGTEAGPFTISGKYLELYIDASALQRIDFSGPNPITLADAVLAINEQLVQTEVAVVSGGGFLELTSSKVGQSGYLEIFNGNAISYLGLTKGATNTGLSAHISMTAGLNFYTFEDNTAKDGTTYYYKWRCLDGVGGTTAWTTPIKMPGGNTVATADTSIGFMKLVGADGQPITSRKIYIYTIFNPNDLAGVTTGVDYSTIKGCTDSTGLFKATLIRGAKIRIVVDETPIIRELVVPDSPSFQIMQISGVDLDSFVSVKLEPDFLPIKT